MATVEGCSQPAGVRPRVLLRMMIRENLEEWGSDAWVEMEAVKQTIAAYDAGAIELPKMAAKANNATMFDCPTSGNQYSKVQNLWSAAVGERPVRQTGERTDAERQVRP